MAQPANKRLVLAAMIFAVAMTFIDQAIVSIAVPELQKDLSLSSTGLHAQNLFETVRLDYAQSIRTVFYAMAAVIALAFVVALVVHACLTGARLRRSVGRCPGSSWSCCP